jgi:hypothetical protein
MSKILRRPMFRGGPVDSRGTGITSGLMDTPSYATGGRVGFFNGGDLLNIFKGADTRGYNNMILGGELYPQSNTTTDVPAMKDYLGTSRNILDQEKDVIVGSDGDTIQKTTEDIFEEDRIQKEADQKKADAMGVTVEEMKAIERENLSTSGVEDIEKEKAILTQPNLSNNNNEQKVELSAKDLIRENAELFKELLNEGQKDRVKKARIGDASDYLLKFFEGSQKEGATVGSAAADVAGFATSKDSKTEKALAAKDKVDQTAVALAINDYVAGKRSKEDIQKAFAVAAGKAKMLQGNIAKRINEDAKGLPVTVSGIQKILREENKPITVIPKDQTKKYEITKEDEGTFIVEEETKNVFEIVNGQKVQRY